MNPILLQLTSFAPVTPHPDLLFDSTTAKPKIGLFNSNIHGDSTMITMPNDSVANIPMSFSDEVGRTVSAPANGGVTSDNTQVCTAAIGADGKSVDITAVGNGMANVGYSNGSISFAVSVTVTDPTIMYGSFEESSVKLTAIPASSIPVEPGNVGLESNGS